MHHVSEHIVGHFKEDYKPVLPRRSMQEIEKYDNYEKETKNKQATGKKYCEGNVMFTCKGCVESKKGQIHI